MNVELSARANTSGPGLGRRQYGGDRRAVLDLDPAELDVGPRGPPLELHGTDPAQELLDRLGSQQRVCRQSLPLVPVAEELEQADRDQVGGRLMSGEQEYNEHRGQLDGGVGGCSPRIQEAAASRSLPCRFWRSGTEAPPRSAGTRASPGGRPSARPGCRRRGCGRAVRTTGGSVALEAGRPACRRSPSAAGGRRGARRRPCIPLRAYGQHLVGVALDCRPHFGHPAWRKTRLALQRGRLIKVVLMGL